MYLLVDRDVGVDGLAPGDVAGLELLDEVDLLPTDEADVAGLALQRRGRTDQERALRSRRTAATANVRCVDDRVD